MTNEEAIKWIKDHHCPDGWDADCKDSNAMRVAIKALERCQMIDDAKPMNSLNADFDFGYNACLVWAKGGE